MVFIDIDDLTPFAPNIDEDKAEAMIADAEALAILAAPCLGEDPLELSDPQLAAVKALLRAAVLRWLDTGTGAVSSQAWGSYSQSLDTRQARRNMFWPSEITALQKICPSEGGVFSIDTAAEPMVLRSMPRSGTGDTVGAIAFDNDYLDDWPFL